MNRLLSTFPYFSRLVLILILSVFYMACDSGSSSGSGSGSGSSSTAQTSSTTVLRGAAFDPTTGEPLAGASVAVEDFLAARALQQVTVTSDQGQFEFEFNNETSAISTIAIFVSGTIGGGSVSVAGLISLGASEVNKNLNATTDLATRAGIELINDGQSPSSLNSSTIDQLESEAEEFLNNNPVNFSDSGSVNSAVNSIMEGFSTSRPSENNQDQSDQESDPQPENPIETEPEDPNESEGDGSGSEGDESPEHLPENPLGDYHCPDGSYSPIGDACGIGTFSFDEVEGEGVLFVSNFSDSNPSQNFLILSEVEAVGDDLVILRAAGSECRLVCNNDLSQINISCANLRGNVCSQTNQLVSE